MVCRPGVDLHPTNPPPPQWGTSGYVWRCFWLSRLGMSATGTSWVKVRDLLNILQGTARPQMSIRSGAALVLGDASQKSGYLLGSADWKKRKGTSWADGNVLYLC